MNTITIIKGGWAVILRQDIYLPAIYKHIPYILTISFFAVVVITNIEERIKAYLLQKDFNDGQRQTLFILYQ